VSELTGEQLTEKFFTEVKGWEKKTPTTLEVAHGQLEDYWNYPNVDGKFYLSIQLLHPLHTSLDLQEEWLWPELWKKGIDYAHFEARKLKGPKIMGAELVGPA